MKLSSFDYDLPPGRIAQHPPRERDGSRLMVLRRPGRPGALPGAAPAAHAEDGSIHHGVFRDLVRHLRPGDLLVLNDTRVIPARLLGTKESGGRVEILLIEPDEQGDGDTHAGSSGRFDRSAQGDEGESGFEAHRLDGPQEQTWVCLAGFSRPPVEGSLLEIAEGLEVRYLGRGPGETHRVRLRPRGGQSLGQALARSGRVPLPPYIERGSDPAGASPEVAAEDAERYQTVYAENDGAIAAPTAGMHFTATLLDALSAKGIRTTRITLHVGPATFLPVRVENVEDHLVPSERYEVPRAAADALAETRACGGRVVAVGTTAVRALESASDGRGGILPARGRTDLFIVPGYRFRTVDALITNFHLPRSTLLMLVCAFAGRERTLAAYEEATARGYRFYSYGDAMLIL